MVTRLDLERDVSEGERHLSVRKGWVFLREREREVRNGGQRKKLNKKCSILIFYWIKFIWSAKWSSLNFAF